MKNKESPAKYIIFFIPWGVSLLFTNSPLTSYLIAWLGSFFIFFMSYSGMVRPLPSDRSIAEQIMRPVFLIQIIFAGYMCCTSIFYLLDIYGYNNFHREYSLLDTTRLYLAAQCQRYYCLGHASFISGIFMFMDYPVKQTVKVEKGKIANLLFVFAIISFPLSILFLKVPGLSQFSNQFSSLSFIACTIALAFAIPLKKVQNTIVCLLLYCSNFYAALNSGFKEPIILSVLVLGIFLYPTYKKLVLLTFIPALLFLFLVLPTYAAIFRQNAWTGREESDVARTEALNGALNKENVADETTWDFLVGRLSEIDMFTEFVQSTPSRINYYGFDLVKQSLIAVIPRIFWPSKPSTEEMVMQRVYDAGVINPHSSVSAKPAYIVDAYLSGGAFGIFICLFIYGAAVQLISLKAEQLFGGYTLGTALIFSGLFQIFWRGLSFEFILNNVVWSFITMLIIAKILRSKNILIPV
ncbi:MAG: exosortase Y-associated Wzy-like protein [Mucilaginibacter sp.]